MKTATVILMAFALMTVHAEAASTMTTSSGASSTSSSSTSTPSPTTHTNGNSSNSTPKGPMWSELSQKQRDCIRDKWAKEGEVIKEAAKICHEKNGGPACMEDIPQLKPCFA